MIRSGYSPKNESVHSRVSAGGIKVGDIIKNDGDFYKVLKVMKSTADRIQFSVLTITGKRIDLSLNYGTYDMSDLYSEDDFRWKITASPDYKGSSLGYSEAYARVFDEASAKKIGLAAIKKKNPGVKTFLQIKAQLISPKN